MDPVVAGAVATVVVSVVSGVVRTVREWRGREVELARITHEALTERVRCAAPWASLRETHEGRRVRVVATAHHASAAGAAAGTTAVAPGIGGGRRGGGDER
ncbi:hypothetical protein ABZ626_35740 [Streptomyces longispororuber]|uniref:hypothetical protein n=1 Tax=Streptomyces longispororuber TaxID=68230 RepID=UPI0033D309F8